MRTNQELMHRERERENPRLKKLVADLSQDNATLKETLLGA
jgi:hypothetical protein